MINESSYKENMKKSAVEKQEKDHAFMLDVFSQMVIDELVVKLERQKLLEDIDRALDKRDEKLFYRLSKQYKEMIDYYYK
mgnify:FL=1